MPRRKKNSSNHLSKKFMNKRISLEELPIKTIKITIHALKWLALLIFLFMTIGIFILFLTGGEKYIQTIVGYSITGFFTFFMGYFGWMFAQSILEMIAGKSDKEVRGLSYYFRKRKKFKI